MSAIQPSNTNMVTGVAQTTASQKQRSVEKDSEEKQHNTLVREQDLLSDQQKHQVEDTLHAEDTRVRKNNEEESHQQRKHRHRRLPEDNLPADQQENTDSEHIDLTA